MKTRSAGVNLDGIKGICPICLLLLLLPPMLEIVLALGKRCVAVIFSRPR